MTLDISKTLEGMTLTVELGGRLDASTAWQLGDEILSSLDGVDELVIDMGDLIYISSAGLRILLRAQKALEGQGAMVVRNVGPDVMDVFTITGFSEYLTIA